MSTKTLLLLFAAVVVAQWLIPLQMVFSKDKVLSQGQVYRFKVRPVDPNDPFRGKYVVLNIDQSMVKIENPEDWQSGETIYLQLARDEEGWAYALKASKEKPEDNSDFLTAKVDFVSYEIPSQVFIQYPFTRYYMEETKAPEAERLLMSDSLSAYLRVRVLNGESAIEALMIGEMTIEEWLDSNKSKEAAE